MQKSKCSKPRLPKAIVTPPPPPPFSHYGEDTVFLSLMYFSVCFCLQRSAKCIADEMRRIVKVQVSRQGTKTALEKLLLEIGFSSEQSKIVAETVRKENLSRSNSAKKSWTMSLTDHKKFLQNFVKSELNKFK